MYVCKGVYAISRCDQQGESTHTPSFNESLGRIRNTFNKNITQIICTIQNVAMLCCRKYILVNDVEQLTRESHWHTFVSYTSNLRLTGMKLLN